METLQSSLEIHGSFFDFNDALKKIWKKKKFVSWFIVICTAIAVVISLLLPLRYTATATILPESEKAKLSGIADLASLAGINIGGSEGSLLKLYPAIIRSESILKNVIFAKYFSVEFKDSVNLIQLWEIEEKTSEQNYDKAFKSLSARLDISLDNKTGLLSLQLEDREPQLTADILNRIIIELDLFIRKKRNTSASAQRQFIEIRLAQIKSELSFAENNLKSFRESNRSIVNSPSLLLGQERLIREVTINNTLYIELKKQYELAKIEEVKNIPIINVLDKAEPPVKKSSPKRAIIVLVVFLFSSIGGMCYIVVKDPLIDNYKRYKKIITNT
ncbi:MAG: Wzz/FepE/Etk N-terminal domain-containing protein [Bacteroidota bacterium]|nr:Wzz/FepE/Etk N-terminal domain-containing protein [Bacteroidota bacterium]